MEWNISSRKAVNSRSLLSLYKSRSSLHLWNDAPLFILTFSLAWSNSFFLHCFSASGFLFLLFDVGNGGAFFCSVVICSLPFFTVWPWMYVVRAGTASAQGKGSADYALHEGGGLPLVYACEWLTLLGHSPCNQIRADILLSLVATVEYDTGRVHSCFSLLTPTIL